jgi:hypothetical protein
MGQSAKRKRLRAAALASAPPAGSAMDPGAQGGRRRPWRPILLGAIPVLSIGAAVASLLLLDSRPGAGMVLLLGCALWLTTFAIGVGGSVPRRDRLRYSGLTFGRKS